MICSFINLNFDSIYYKAFQMWRHAGPTFNWSCIFGSFLYIYCMLIGLILGIEAAFLHPNGTNYFFTNERAYKLVRGTRTVENIC